jgi:hypothetical protein
MAIPTTVSPNDPFTQRSALPIINIRIKSL